MGQVQRRLATKLDNYSDLRSRLRFVVVHSEHVLERQRFKVEPIASIVIGRNCLRIAIDHDGFVAIIFERKSRVAAAVIEFNSLPDAIRARSQNDDLWRLCRWRLIFFVVGRVEIRGHRFKLGGAGVHQLEDGFDPHALAQFPHLLHALVSFELPLGGDTFIAKAETLEVAKALRAYILRSSLCNFHLRKRDLAHLEKKPGIHARVTRHFTHAHASLECEANVTKTLRSRRNEHLGQAARIQNFRTGLFPCFQRAPRLHQRFLKGPAYGHHLADRLHLRTQGVVGSRKFFELPLGNLDDDVIDGRFKTRWRFARNVVRNLVECVTNSKFGGDLRDRKSSCL